MPARLVQVTLRNRSSFSIHRFEDGRVNGIWQDPWYPSNITDLQPNEEASFRSESSGVMKGTKAWAIFKVHIISNNIGDRAEFFRLDWEKPFFGGFRRNIDHQFVEGRPADGRVALTRMVEVDLGPLGSNQNILTQLAESGIPPHINVLLNDMIGNHVRWVVEVRDTGAESTILPLHVAPKGVIYAVSDNGDLLWFRHEGRDDGSFAWTDNNARKIGNEWNGLSTVFSGGDGVIYAITEASRDPRTGRRTGGDLLWFRHEGRDDGSFAWTDNNARKVGDGWNVKQAFSGGDGVIYAITDNGDLLWFRHEGRDDGSFRWASNEGKKVGNGWNVKHAFSGGDGVIYAVADNGDLLWNRHEGRDDGSFRWASNEGKKVGNEWNGLSTVFSGGDGVIYAITEASRDPRIGQRTGGDLLWFRHEGRDDGSFRWASNEGKKVGVGWNMKHVFSG